MDAPRNLRRRFVRVVASLGIALGIATVPMATASHADGSCPPSNDDFASAQPISGDSGTIPVTFCSSTLQAGEPALGFPVDPSFGSVWYAFTATTRERVVFSQVEGSGLLARAYTGSDLSSLTPVTPATDGNPLSVSVDPSQTAYLQVLGSNDGSRDFVLQWSVPQTPPWNDDQIHAADLNTFHGNVLTGSNLGATAEPGEVQHAGAPASASVWYRWTAPTDGTFTVTLSSNYPYAASDLPAWAARLDAYVDTGSGFGSGLTPVATSHPVDEGQASRQLQLTAVADTEYWITVDGIDATPGASVAIGAWQGNFSLQWGYGPANDDFANAIPLTGLSGMLDMNLFGATVQPGEPDHQGRPSTSSTWFQITTASTQIVSINTSVESATGPGVLAAYEGTAIDALTPEPTQVFVGGVFGATLTFVSAPGQTYQIAFAQPKNGADSVSPSGLYRVGWSIADLPSPPPNDNFANAVALTETSGAVDGTTAGATTEAGPNDQPNSVWYSYSPATHGTLSLSGSGNIMIGTGTSVATWTPLGSNTLDVNPGTTYAIAVFNGTGQPLLAGPFTLNYSFQGIPANDNIADAIVLNGYGGR